MDRKPAKDLEIRVTSTDFDADPVAYVRQATATTRVVVSDANDRVAAVFGGSLDHSPSLDDALEVADS